MELICGPTNQSQVGWHSCGVQGPSFRGAASSSCQTIFILTMAIYIVQTETEGQISC